MIKIRKAMILILIVLGITVILHAVNRNEEFKKHLQLKNNSIFKNIKWKGLGPYFMGGRITDIEAYENKPYTYLLATASGGLWKTENNGTTWKSLFDDYSSITLGDIAVSQTNENLIWAGTGEENSSRSSYAGTGVFKSIDGGKTWKNMGLGDSHHISEILIDPKNNDIVYVAVLGHLYTKNDCRGVFKTLDGGKNWKKVLYINDNTGIIDLVMNPKNPEILFAASWDKGRKAWNMVESGVGSSIYKTIDGGKKWKKAVNGFPQDKYTGRIGLSISRSNPDIVYAFLDNQTPRPQKKKKKLKSKSGLSAELFMKMKKEDFLRLPNKKLTMFLKEVDAPKQFNADAVKNMIKTGQISLKSIASSLLKKKDANYKLLNSTVKGAEVYRSNDGGKTWFKTHKKMLSRGIVSTYGYYFGKIYVSPENPDIIYILGVPFKKSIDGGKTFKNSPDVGGSYGRGLFDVHPDHHALWIDPKNPKRILLGNDGGLNISYDAGKTFTKINNIPLAQSYSVNYDMQKPYRIYTGLQDNGVNMGPSDFVFGNRNNPWKMILGGDGAFVAPDLNDPNTVYCEFQFGNIFAVDLKGNRTRRIVPEPKNPKESYRFNWLAPFKISKHNPYTLYMGANKLLKSINRGKTWFEVSEDLTDKKHIDGDVPFATITAIDESPLDPAILYAGTDDGNLWVTKNFGKNWIKINSGLPKKWVTRVVASKYNKAHVFVTMTGYREDDFTAYVYKSDDFGKTWKSIKSNLPEESVNVIREDPINKNILYLGTELSVYISLNGGEKWYSLRGNLPTNAVYDLQIHPRERDLMIGCHGRGVFITNVKNIQNLNEKILNTNLYIFKIAPYKISKSYYRGKKKITFYIKNGGVVKITVYDARNKILFNNNRKYPAGLNSFQWDMRYQKKYVKKGKYKVKLKIGKNLKYEIFEIK